MKATLTFSLPEEQEQHKDALNGSLYKFVLQDFDNYLRGRIKYEELENDVGTALQDARDHLNQLMKDRDVSVWE